jgi:tryptophan halogenase
VAIGLAQAFVEPLEATSIHATIVQLDLLLTNTLNFSFTKENVMFEANIKKYNTFINTLVDDVKDLIQLHYMTQREDTEFWKNYKYEVPKTEVINDILEICKYRSPSMLDFNFYHGSGNWGVWCWTLIGLGHLPKEIAKLTLDGYKHSEEQLDTIYKAIKNRNFLNKIKLMDNKEFFNRLINKKL